MKLIPGVGFILAFIAADPMEGRLVTKLSDMTINCIVAHVNLGVLEPTPETRIGIGLI